MGLFLGLVVGGCAGEPDNGIHDGDVDRDPEAGPTKGAGATLLSSEIHINPRGGCGPGRPGAVGVRVRVIAESEGLREREKSESGRSGQEKGAAAGATLLSARHDE